MFKLYTVEGIGKSFQVNHDGGFKCERMIVLLGVNWKTLPGPEREENDNCLKCDFMFNHFSCFVFSD